ncbi:prepilin peptidase [Kamptonema animale CS-326]|jgi:leader peptidase (prepilin peptidase)/N-methyltransferase|uniref:prepilin peptidase n=1 Tax=Kamptonema animale TaxID=92934 RepID=UPI0023301C4A|nr:A24 family peptidase [Kamptonema animale]MDB9515090.1 prepilin peptidase [Kamptonema animale CS-326]
MEILTALPFALIIFVLGASIGSFLNVVVYRLPAKLSVLWPPSRCPQCLHQLRLSENVPVFGWLWLRGRCKHCRSPISARYPIVEAATGLMFLLVFWRFGLTLETLGYWTFFSWLLALSLIDLDTMTLPNALTRSGLVLGLVFQALNGLLPTFNLAVGIDRLVLTGVIGAVVGLWLFDIIALAGSLVFGQTAMGAGDTKLAAMMGAWLGWKYLLLAGFLACALGAFVGGGAIALGWLGRRQQMPFGPFLALGAVLTALWGEMIISIYLQLFFPNFSL